MQNTFSQSGNDSKWFLKKIIFQNSLMANETPSRPPPFMANAILNFHFDFPHPSLRHVLHDHQTLYDLTAFSPPTPSPSSRLTQIGGTFKNSCKNVLTLRTAFVLFFRVAVLVFCRRKCKPCFCGMLALCQYTTLGGMVHRCTRLSVGMC